MEGNAKRRALQIPQVIDQQLQAMLALEFVDIQAIDQLDGAGRRDKRGLLADVIEGDRIERAAGARHFDPHLQVPLADDARLPDQESPIEAGLWKGLSPWASGTQRTSGLQRNLLHRQLPVGL